MHRGIIKLCNTVNIGYNDIHLGAEKCPYIRNVTVSDAGSM